MIFRPGDEIEIKVRVGRCLDDHPNWFDCGTSDDRRLNLHADTLNAGRLIPRPIGVGEKVKWGTGDGHGTVVYIRDGWAVVDHGIHTGCAIDRPCTVLLSDLTLDDKG